MGNLQIHSITVVAISMLIFAGNTCLKNRLRRDCSINSIIRVIEKPRHGVCRLRLDEVENRLAVALLERDQQEK
jgi:hypothetical protein